MFIKTILKIGDINNKFKILKRLYKQGVLLVNRNSVLYLIVQRMLVAKIIIK